MLLILLVPLPLLGHTYITFAYSFYNEHKETPKENKRSVNGKFSARNYFSRQGLAEQVTMI